MRTSESSGFTLIELLATVVIIAVLAAVAYPSYMDYLRKAKRTEGKVALLKATQYQERYFTDNNRYADANTFPTLYGMAAGAVVYSSDDGRLLPPPVSPPSYTISVVLGGVPLGISHTMTATPNPPFTDPECGNLTITSTGARDRTGAAPVSKCW